MRKALVSGLAAHVFSGVNLNEEHGLIVVHQSRFPAIAPQHDVILDAVSDQGLQGAHGVKIEFGSADFCLMHRFDADSYGRSAIQLAIYDFARRQKFEIGAARGIERGDHLVSRQNNFA
jgi:hypothetical protein